MFRIFKKNRHINRNITRIENNNNNIYLNLEIENNFLKQEINNLKKELLYQKEYNYKNDIKYKNLLYKSITNKNKDIILLSKTIVNKDKKISELTENINSIKEEYQHVNKYLCCICITNPKNILIYPCNHICFCLDCYNSSNITHCPICRQSINVVAKVYL